VLVTLLPCQDNPEYVAIRPVKSRGDFGRKHPIASHYQRLEMDDADQKREVVRGANNDGMIRTLRLRTISRPHQPSAVTYAGHCQEGVGPSSL